MKREKIKVSTWLEEVVFLLARWNKNIWRIKRTKRDLAFSRGRR